MTQTITEQVQASISILKGNWRRKDGSHWMNDRGFVEPYRHTGRIPVHESDDSSVGGKIGITAVDSYNRSERELSDSVRLQKLLDMEPIKVNGISFENLITNKDIRIKAWNAFLNLKNEIASANKNIKLNDGRIVVLTNKGFKKIVSHSASLLVLKIIPNLKDLLEKSVYLFSEPNTKNKTDVDYFESRATKLKLNGKEEYFVRFVLRKEHHKLELLHYDHNLTKADLIGEVTIPNPDQLTKPGEREESLPKDKLYQWIINASRNQNKEMDNNQDISKGFFGFGNNKQSTLTGGGSPPRQGLVKKQIIDSRGRRQTKWVRPQDVQTPIEKKREQAKIQRKKVIHLNHSEEDKKKIEEITKRHKEFENKAKEQRRAFGSGPQLPKPGLVMRVYAKGKVNVGGMLAEVQRIAEDGRSVIAMLTSGKTYEFPLDQLHFAKSILYHSKRDINE